MEFMTISRDILNSKFVVREKENGDIEILEEVDELEEYTEVPFEVDGISYVWVEWATKEVWKDVWINDFQQNGSDTTITNFYNLEDAIAEINS